MSTLTVVATMINNGKLVIAVQVYCFTLPVVNQRVRLAPRRRDNWKTFKRYKYEAWW